MVVAAAPARARASGPFLRAPYLLKIALTLSTQNASGFMATLRDARDAGVLTMIHAEDAGIVAFNGIVEGLTLSVDLDEKTRMKQPVITESADKSVHPSIQIVNKKTGRKINEYILPTGAFLLVGDGEDRPTIEGLCGENVELLGHERHLLVSVAGVRRNLQSCMKSLLLFVISLIKKQWRLR